MNNSNYFYSLALGFLFILVSAVPAAAGPEDPIENPEPDEVVHGTPSTCAYLRGNDYICRLICATNFGETCQARGSMVVDDIKCGVNFSSDPYT